jgi:hypothetical protein
VGGGRNVRIDIRWAASDAALMQRFAKELIALQPDLIVSHNTPTTASLQQQTRTIPIVFVIVSDPVGSGFVASFPRPGGNITGFTNIEPTMAGRRTGAGPSICRPRSRTRGAVADILRRSTARPTSPPDESRGQHRRSRTLDAPQGSRCLEKTGRGDSFGSGLIDPLQALQLADPRTATTTPPRPLRQR